MTTDRSILIALNCIYLTISDMQEKLSESKIIQALCTDIHTLEKCFCFQLFTQINIWQKEPIVMYTLSQTIQLLYLYRGTKRGLMGMIRVDM